MRSALFIAIAGAAAMTLPAQGYIKWPVPNGNVTAQLLHYTADTHHLYIPGWTTVAAPGPEMTGGEGAGVEVPGGGNGVRDVSGAGLVEENKGKALEEMVVFPFVPDDDVVQGLTSPSFTWHGVVAAPIGVVPNLEPGALRLDLQSGTAWHTLRPMMTGARAFVAETDLQGFRTGQNISVVRIAEVVPARLAYFKFERGLGDYAINYGGYPGVNRTAAVVSSAAAAAWPPGVVGAGTTALPSSNFAANQFTYCDTGWDGGLFGSVTFAWYMRQGSPLSAQAMEVFSGPGGLRCTTGGGAGTGLRFEGWGGPPLQLANVQGQAAAGWTHIALVIDVRTTPNTATWYVNGTAQPSTNVPNGAVIAPLASNTLRIGSTTNPYEIDEFRLLGAAANPAVVQSWAQTTEPAATTYGVSCGAILRQRGPAPSTTNPQLNLFVEGEANQPCVLFLDIAEPLQPIDLGTLFPGLQGCLFYSGAAVSLPSSTNQDGLASFQINIPAGVPASVIYGQALVAGPGGIAAANAHATALQ